MHVMRMKKILLSALVLGLAMQVQAADSLRVKSWPLYFKGVGTRASDGSYSHDDSLLQEEYWLNLMKYKLWGTTGIEVKLGAIIIADNVGYNGTAKGDFSIANERILDVSNDYAPCNGDGENCVNHHFGGPTIVGGNFTFHHSTHDRITTGPVRVSGNLQVRGGAGSRNVMEGNWCVGDTIKGEYEGDLAHWNSMVSGVYNANYTLDKKKGDYNACTESIAPKVETDMDVPIWPTSTSTVWESAINLTSNYSNEVAFIHVPPDSVQKNQYGTFDIYIEDFKIGGSTGKVLYVLMPPGGKITRIYSRNGFSFDASANDMQIIVAYVNEGLKFDATTMKWDVAEPAQKLDNNGRPFNPAQPANGSSWEFTDGGKFKAISNKDYAGNLMFYTQKDIIWNYWKDASFVGSWFTTGTMKVGGHFKLAGQLIAGKLEFTNDVTGDFRYVPIDPPEIDPTIFAKDYVYWERDTLEVLPIKLSKEPETNVTFDYCYSFMSPCNWGDGLCAEEADLNIVDPNNPQRKLPICGVDLGHVIIPKGSLAATDTAFMPIINVKKDGKEENDEYLKLNILNLAGAVVKYNGNTYFDGKISVNIQLGDRDRRNDPPVFVCEDEDGNPIDCDDLLKITENDAGAKAGTVKATDKEGDPVTFALGGQYRSNGVEDVDIFEIDPTTGEVKLKAGVSVNYEEDQYFGVDIKAMDEKHVTVKSFRVSVRDVNEKPIIIGNAGNPDNPKVYSADEDFADNDVVGKVKVGDTDSLHQETSTEKFRDNIVKAVGGDTHIFKVEESGIIRVIHGDSLDYEKDSIYTLLIRAEDRNDSTLFDTTTITIKIIDKDDPPILDSIPKIIVIPPPDTSSDDTPPDTLPNLINLDRNKQGAVEENNPANVIVGAIKATCTDTTKTLIYEIVTDTSGLFTMDPATGVVIVKKEMVLDYEAVQSYEIKVRVSDGVDAGSGKTADGTVVQTDERDVIIRVIDVNEAPVVEQQKFYVEENKPVATPVDPEPGKLVSTDPDSLNDNFKVNVYTALSGDTALFMVNPVDGTIMTKTVMNFEEYAATGDTLFNVVVRVANYLDKSGKAVFDDNGKLIDGAAVLYDTATITIALRDVNEPPEIITDTVQVEENSKGGTVVDTIKAVDPENPNETITFTQIGTSDFDVSEDGVITVKDGAKIDYEKTPILKITVRVVDSHGVADTNTITVKVIDVNEPPVLNDTTVVFVEDDSIGTIRGPVVATDPDKDPKHNTLKYYLVGEDDTFDVLEDGRIKLKDSLDYETDSLYYITVRVTDGESSDTAKVTIKVKNVVEHSVVKITKAENPDSLWNEPDTIYVNKPDLDFCWAQGVENRGKLKEFCSDTTLVPGKTVITREYKDPSTDHPGVARLIVFYSDAAPVVKVTKATDPAIKGNIYTIVEQTERDESTFFVKSTKTEVKVSVIDTASNTDESFSIKIDLDHVSIPEKYYKIMSSIADEVLPLNESAKGTVRTPVNGEKIAVSYKDTVDGNAVVVTYYTDLKGNILKGESGEEEMTVSYTKTIDGTPVTISFQANAATGRLVESKNGASYTISYDYVDAKKNSVNVSYCVDEKGKLVKDSSGDLGYKVSYTYVNKFGNSATEFVTIILDTKPPLVKIKSPVNDQVLTSNMATVEWYVSVTGDSADFVLQDTLNIQGLDKGANTIVRFFIDKAGNMASDTVYVIMKNAKDLDIAVEDPVTILTADKVEEYYNDDNKPKKGQTFAVSIANPTTGEEKETLIGGDFKTTKGSGDTPYSGKKGHLGPTLSIDVKLPVYKPGDESGSKGGAVSGLATLDDLVGKDGLVSLDGIDAENSEKTSVSEYVQKYCTAEFASNYSKSDFSSVNLYNSKLKVKVWIFTTLGTFVDYYTFTQDLNDPDYVNDAGLLKMYFEQKPDKDGYVRTESGKLYATGAYIYRTEIKLVSELNCTLPPVNDPSNNQTMGAVIKNTDDLTKSFGYKRPDYK
jgi:Cadherin domain.